ncbi:YggS family pyridoxal phosphate-dependent enzyme [Acholeplasma equifetale]|uniref:YggS family pyridoxal phosphate-dependent enzyme n=1 Tax=Acholeplasma equifetale TaxID=264634 RepID=UPI00069176BF|nr:YggS family pyridoxal phosphate-dependent enzyme [Acholeplasma equifetale]
MNFLEYKDKIICASKYYTVDEMIKIHQLGINHFGENYVQDLINKKNQLKDTNIIWHLIGHLQRNKVKQVINEIEYFHALDSIKLAKEIQKYRKEPLKCFIELNLSRDVSKHGIFEEELNQMIQEIKNYDKIIVIGLMAMGKYNDLSETENIFSKLVELKHKYQLPMVSMGMSDDYEIAIKYHSDFLRIGSLFKGVI